MSTELDHSAPRSDRPQPTGSEPVEAFGNPMPSDVQDGPPFASAPVTSTAPALQPPRWSGKKTAVAAALAIGFASVGAVGASAALSNTTSQTGTGTGQFGGGPGGMPGGRQFGGGQGFGGQGFGSQQGQGGTTDPQQGGTTQQGTTGQSGTTGTTTATTTSGMTT